MSGEPYDLRDPGQLVADVMARHPLREGDGLIVCVREASGEQALIDVVRIAEARWRHLDRVERSELLAKTARRLPIPKWNGGPPNHSIVTVVARGGFAVFGSSEAEWMIAWHYSNHQTNAYSADLILVTEHGWTDFMSGWGGHEPSLALGVPA
jgi:hypothetical protein